MSVASWQMVFLTPPLFAVVVFLWSFRLEESLPPERRTPLAWATIRKNVWAVVGNRVFLRYMTTTTILFAALSSYVASSERIIGEIYGKPELFAWIFAGIGLLMSLCAFTNSRLSSRYGARRTVKGLLVVYTIVGSLLLIVTVVAGDPPDMLVFFVALAIMLAINLAVEPNSSALALEPMGEMAGMAASVYGTLFFFVGSSLGALISHFMVHGVFPLVISFFAIGVVTLVLVFTDRRAVA
jgi:MFS transporter, DHA1 family, multidrug resistance protein